MVYGRNLTPDLCARIAAVDAKHGVAVASRRFGVSESTIRRIRRGATKASAQHPGLAGNPGVSSLNLAGASAPALSGDDHNHNSTQLTP